MIRNILLILILLTSSTLAGIINKTIIEDGGGDYTSLEACLDDNEQDLTNGQGDDFIASIEGDWTQGDSTTVAIDGWTTDSDSYITITTNADARHPGYWSEADYILAANATRGMFCKEPYTVIEGLQVDGTTSGGLGIWFLDDPNGARVSHCIVKGNNSSGQIVVSNLLGGQKDTIYIYNNIIYDVGSRGIDINHDSARVWAYNNTIHTTTSVGIYAQAGSTVAINNLVTNVSTFNYFGTFHSSSDYNTGDDGTSTGGGNDRINQTFTFDDEGANDFHLASNDAGARDHGTDLSGDGDLPFSDDIDGETRTGTWDMGADEFISGAPADEYEGQVIIIGGQ